MEPSDFLEALRQLDIEAFNAVEAGIGAHLGTPAGEIEWWEATILVERMLRAHGDSRRAATAAHHAVVAVRGAASRCGIDDIDRVTRVARSAADVVRALCAGQFGSDVSAGLMETWSPLLTGVRAAV